MHWGWLMAEKASAPTVAIGYTQAQTYNQMWLEEETTPELQWPQSIAVYDQMRRSDSQCAAVLKAVTLPVRQTPWRIDPAGAKLEVAQFVADNLGLPVVGQKPKPPLRAKDKFSWKEHLRLALLMLPMGHAYFEQIYRVDDAGERAYLRKLELRPSRTIERIDVANDGGLVAIKQFWTATNTAPRPIPVNRLVAYIHDREGGNWLGTSILRSAYKNFLLKERLLRVQAQTIERNGMGIPLYKGQENASGTDLEAGKAMATAWRAGEAAGSAVPFGADLVLRGVEGTLPDALPVIQYHDDAIARAVLAHFLNLGTQTGSWALGTTFADFFTLSLQTLAQQIADTASQHIIEDLVDVNFGPQEPAPRLVFDEIGSRQAATAQAMKLLVDAGLIKPDDVLDETLRQQYGLPPADPATAAPPPTQAAPERAPEPEPVAGEGSVAASAGEVGPKDVAVTAAEAEPVVAHGTHNQKDHGRRLPKAGNLGENPFGAFDRRQLRDAAKRRGIALEPRESRESIERKLVRYLAGDDEDKGDSKPDAVSELEDRVAQLTARLDEQEGKLNSVDEANLRFALTSAKRDLSEARAARDRQQKAAKASESPTNDETPSPTPTATPTRMTREQYTQLLRDENVRLATLRGMSQQDAQAQVDPDASIDELKKANTSLRARLRNSGIDYRTDEQKRTDDAEKNRLLDEVERLAAASGHDGPAKRAGASKMSRRELEKFVADAQEFQERREAKRDAESKGSAAVSAFNAAEDAARATSRQVGYIKGLLRQRASSGGGSVDGPTETEDIRKLSNAQARAYINRLLRG